MTSLLPAALLALRYYYSRKVILAYLECALHTDMADIEQYYMKPPGESALPAAPGRGPGPGRAGGPLILPGWGGRGLGLVPGFPVACALWFLHAVSPGLPWLLKGLRTGLGGWVVV